MKHGTDEEFGVLHARRNFVFGWISSHGIRYLPSEERVLTMTNSLLRASAD